MLDLDFICDVGDFGVCYLAWVVRFALWVFVALDFVGCLINYEVY